MKYDTIIIGGGLAGLTAGATLAKFGKKVLLLEQHYKPGGCATTFKRGDFIVEVGLHEMSGYFEGSTISTIFEMLEVDKHVEFTKVPEFFAAYSGERKFVFPHGYSEAENALIEKYPEDKQGIKRFFKLLRGLRSETTRLPRSPFLKKLIYPLMPLLYPSIVEGTKLTVGEWLDKYFTNEQAKLDIVSHISYWGNDPYTLSMFYFALPFSGFVENGGHFIKGGSQQLSSYLASYIEKKGGSVLLGKTVEKIETNNGKVSGVLFRDSYNSNLESITVSCDNAIANCAIPLVPLMLDEPFSSELKNKITSKTNSLSLLCIYLGFKTDVTKYGVEHYSNYFRGHDVKALKDIKTNNSGDWSKRSFIFVDYGKVDARLTPPEKSEGVICVVEDLKNWEGLSKEENEKNKDKIAKILLERLNEKFPRIKESIEYLEVATPRTIKRYTKNPSGSVYGYAQTLDQTAAKRFRDNFLISNLYFGSAWAFPGGGFEGSITGGFLVALQMNKDKIWGKVKDDRLPDNRVLKFSEYKKLDDNTIELSFQKPIGIGYKKDEYVVLRLVKPEKSFLDLPYRWLPIKSSPDEDRLKFEITLEDNSFTKSCSHLKEGDEVILFGPMG